MLDESEVRQIVTESANRLGVPVPRLSLSPARISFMAVLVMNGGVTITPVAREALTPEAIEFAVVYGLVSDTRSRTGRGGRRLLIGLIGLAIGSVVSSGLHGIARPLVAVVTTLVATVACLFTSSAIQAKWPSQDIERQALAVLPSLDGAREYVQKTDRFNLNGETPKDWDGPHGRLVDLERLERIARETGRPRA